MADELCQRIPDLCVLVAGEGGLETELRELHSSALRLVEETELLEVASPQSAVQGPKSTVHSQTVT